MRSIKRFFNQNIGKKRKPNAFKDIYFNDLWHSQESKSGKGSELKNTQNVREILKEIVIKYNINSIFDIPCGDFNWMKKIVDLFNDYKGADILEELINENNKKYTSEKIQFEKLDILKTQIPKVDLVLCRDLFIHFSNQDINKALENIIDSNSTYLLASTYIGVTNKKIRTGEFRPVDLTKKPFMLPKPIEIFFDGYGGPETHSSMKHIGLWNIGNQFK